MKRTVIGLMTLLALSLLVFSLTWADTPKTDDAKTAAAAQATPACPGKTAADAKNCDPAKCPHAMQAAEKGKCPGHAAEAVQAAETEGKAEAGNADPKAEKTGCKMAEAMAGDAKECPHAATMKAAEDGKSCPDHAKAQAASADGKPCCANHAAGKPCDPKTCTQMKGAEKAADKSGA